MKKRYTFFRSAFLLFAMFLIKTSVVAQCVSNGPEPNSILSPSCTNQVTATNGIGAGANIFYLGFVPNTWYAFNLGNQPLLITCGSANFADVNQTILGSWSNILNTTSYMFSPPNTAQLTVQTSSTAWNTTSAALQYRIATPTDPAWSSSPTQVCQNSTATYSIAASSYATSYIWTVSGTNYIDGVPGQTTINSNTTSITVTFANPFLVNTVSVYATNNGLCNSNTATATVYSNLQPGIATQPVSTHICPGGSSSLSLQASGGPTLTYQWQYSDSGNWVNVADGIPAGVTYSGDSANFLHIFAGTGTAPGAYNYQCIVTSGGCGSITSDSVALTVLPIVTDTVNQTICQGQIYDGHGVSGTFVDTFSASFGCDSIRTLNLIVLPLVSTTIAQTICSNQSYYGYSASGTYTDTFQVASSCDSVRTLNLTVLPVIAVSVTQTICSNQSFEGRDSTGTYIDTFSGSNGCDSIRTLHLTVLPVALDTISQTICSNQSYYGHTASGTYTDVFHASNGCDSTRVLNLTVLPVVATTISQTVCANQNPYRYPSSGTYLDTLKGSNGCDSIRLLHLTVLPLYLTAVNQNICAGQSYSGHTVTGTYVDTFSSANGCDSIRTLNLVVQPIVTSTIVQTICANQNYYGHTVAGTYTDTLQASNGCDSIRTLNLSVVPLIADTIPATICYGSNYGGHIATGTYVDTFSGSNGCDSVRTLSLTALPVADTIVYQTICFGQNYAGHNSTGLYLDTLTGSNGCDSIIRLHLTVRASLPYPIISVSGNNVVQVTLPGYTYQWFLNGTAIPGDTTQTITIATSGLYSIEITDTFGCTLTSPALNIVYIGISEINGDMKLLIFPNPTSGTLNIRAEGLADEQTVSIGIYDQLGQLVLNEIQRTAGDKFSTQLNVQHLAPGMYEIQLQQGTNMTRQKLVIER